MICTLIHSVVHVPRHGCSGRAHFAKGPFVCVHLPGFKFAINISRTSSSSSSGADVNAPKSSFSGQMSLKNQTHTRGKTRKTSVDKRDIAWYVLYSDEWLSINKNHKPKDNKSVRRSFSPSRLAIVGGIVATFLFLCRWRFASNGRRTKDFFRWKCAEKWHQWLATHTCFGAVQFSRFGQPRIKQWNMKPPFGEAVQHNAMKIQFLHAFSRANSSIMLGNTLFQQFSFSYVRPAAIWK